MDAPDQQKAAAKRRTVDARGNDPRHFVADFSEDDVWIAPELYDESAADNEELDPLGREVSENEPIPPLVWWKRIIGVAGALTSLVYIYLFVNSMVVNLSTSFGGPDVFVEAGLGMVGALLSFSLLLGYLKWMKYRGSLTGLAFLLIATLLPVIFDFLPY